MSESEFEEFKHDAEWNERYGKDSTIFEDAVYIAGLTRGIDLARDWILSKANKLDKHYLDDNEFPQIFLDDL